MFFILIMIKFVKTVDLIGLPLPDLRATGSVLFNQFILCDAMDLKPKLGWIDDHVDSNTTSVAKLVSYVNNELQPRHQNETSFAAGSVRTVYSGTGHGFAADLNTGSVVCCIVCICDSHLYPKTVTLLTMPIYYQINYVC